MLHSVLSALLLVALPVRAATDEEKAIDKVEDLGGMIQRDEKATGKPVVSVDLRGGHRRRF